MSHFEKNREERKRETLSIRVGTGRKRRYHERKKKKKTEAHQDPEEGRCGKISRITDEETGPKSLPTTNTSSPSAEDFKKGFWLHDV